MNRSSQCKHRGLFPLKSKSQGANCKFQGRRCHLQLSGLLGVLLLGVPCLSSLPTAGNAGELGRGVFPLSPKGLSCGLSADSSWKAGGKSLL